MNRQHEIVYILVMVREQKILPQKLVGTIEPKIFLCVYFQCNFSNVTKSNKEKTYVPTQFDRNTSEHNKIRK